MLFFVGIEICGSDISQFINVVENSTNWCVHIKILIYDHILTLGKHLRYDFYISVEEILEDDVDGLLDGVSVVIAQISDVLRVNRYDDLLS